MKAAILFASCLWSLSRFDGTGPPLRFSGTLMDYIWTGLSKIRQQIQPCEYRQVGAESDSFETLSGLNIPDDIMISILSLLPVISLLRFRSVCKSWRSTILNLQFMQIHLTNSNKKPGSILKIFLPDGGCKMVRITREDFVRLKLPPHGNTQYKFMRSCNGLVCLANSYGNLIQLWNPSTMQFKEIMGPDKHSRYHQFHLGFGFDYISNDYKILILVLSKSSDLGIFTSVLEGKLYSLNADSWKNIQVPESILSCLISNSVLAITGVLYLEAAHALVSLDLHTEVFGEYPLPNSVQHERKSHVLDFEGSVAMVFTSVSDGPVLSLWTLDDVCGNVSWTKKFNIEADLRIDRLVLYLGVGQFVALNNDIGYIFYDYRKKETKIFPLPTPAREVMLIVKYIESLVSLEGFEQLELSDK